MPAKTKKKTAAATKTSRKVQDKKKPKPAKRADSAKAVKPVKAVLKRLPKKTSVPSKKVIVETMNMKASPNKPMQNLTVRQEKLQRILLEKRATILREIQAQLGQSLNDEQQRRLESAMDSGDQAWVDLEREMGISLQEMRNRERQLIDAALVKLKDGTYGMCAECGGEISEKRLEALPFATYCVVCQSKRELLEKIERGEQRV